MKPSYLTGLAILVFLAGCSLFPWQQETSVPIQTLFVGSNMVSCDNPLRQNLCLLVKHKLEDSWQLYSSAIMGFDYTPGFVYELEVQYDPGYVKDKYGPDIQWVLYRVVSKKQGERSQFIPRELVDGVWKLQQMMDSSVTLPVDSKTPPTLLFQSDGHIDGSTGCNRFNSAFSISDDQLTFDSISMTKKMCPKETGLLVQEQNFLSILNNSEHFTVTKDDLQIFSAGGKKSLLFKH
ncbi:MAG: META domain-containing protein [Leptolinea sp.]|jgi:heat shock protein HslJ|nr:META domain-containing protein [Leptolinea sp.]